MKIIVELECDCGSKKDKGSGWIRLKSIDQLPKDVTFLLLDEKRQSGGSVFEATMFDTGKLGCPVTLEDYNIEDFSHWRSMLEMP